jgi:hypothetical protein
MNPNKATYTFPVVSFRHLETPFQKEGYRDYFAIVDTSDLPKIPAHWREINVRDPKLTGAVPRAIRESFRSKPDMFVFLNRGIVLAVESVTFDNKSSFVTITLSNPELHGLLDGGHTYNIIAEETPELQKPQYVRIEFLEGFNHEDITDVVDARNTSNQVRDQSLMNLAKKFDGLKVALAKEPYYEQIAFSEYEIGTDGNPKPIDIREVVALLTTFDRDHFTDSSHPIMAYNSKQACLNHFSLYPESYQKIFPLAKEILPLYDHIREQLPFLYNKVRGQTDDVSGGRFGRLTGVAYRDGKKMQSLNYLNKDSKYGVPDGFVYPILGAFRSLIEEKKGVYVWGKGLKPVDLLKNGLGLKLADAIGNFALETQNPSKTGKSFSVWNSCYLAVQISYLTAK